MRTTLDIDRELLRKAMEETGLTTKKAVVEEGLRMIVQTAARKRLIALTGTMPNAKAPPRRRFK